jgi:hypothetical protein
MAAIVGTGSLVRKSSTIALDQRGLLLGQEVRGPGYDGLPTIPFAARAESRTSTVAAPARSIEAARRGEECEACQSARR